MSLSFSISVAWTPVSSRTSRVAASAGVSPGSMCPLGSASTSPPFTRTAAMYGRPRNLRTTTPPAENSRSSALGAIRAVPDERHEAHRHHRLGAAVGVEAHEALVAAAAHRADDDAVGGELLHQRRGRAVVGRGGHRDPPEWRPVGRAPAAVAGPHLHVLVA